MTGYADKSEIARITDLFYDAFTNKDGRTPDVDRLYELLLPGAIVVKNLSASPELYDVRAFVEPRRAILTDGTLRDFVERETSEHTEVVGNIAQRLSHYRKSWIQGGETHQGIGVKSLQFVKTPHGWKIASVVWDDL